MHGTTLPVTLIATFILLTASCTGEKEGTMKFTGAHGEVVLMTLEPGHFHAGLVQKTMYDQVSPTVYVYSSGGPDLEDHLKRIEGYNSRAENPTHWNEIVYTGDDFFEKMLEEKSGNVLVTAGNNTQKTKYIKAAVDAGVNVFADKPMCIDSAGFELLKEAFQSAEQRGSLLYDIMTERYEITSMLQKELANTPEVFGEFQPGSPDEPSVVKESVHHLFKYVSGEPIQRPGWFFDVSQQGEGIVDIGTHLVDLVMWGCFPEQIIDPETDIHMLRASHWPTMVDQKQFEKVTRLPDFPDFLKSALDEQGALPYFCNGEMIYRIRGIHAKVSVVWNFEAPEGTGDTHYSVMRGTKASILILQDKEQNYRTELYVEAAEGVSVDQMETVLQTAVANLRTRYPGIAVRSEGSRWHIMIPDSYRVGHEAHFGQVTEKYLEYLTAGNIPAWEVPNMIAKYYTTTSALELCRMGN